MIFFRHDLLQKNKKQYRKGGKIVGYIKILDESVSNIIAAGEVVKKAEKKEAEIEEEKKLTP